MKVLRINSVFAVLDVVLTIIALPTTVMAAIDLTRATKYASFNYTLGMEQTKTTDAFNFDTPSNTTGSASTKFTWTSVKHSLQSGYYTEVTLQRREAFIFWVNVTGPTKIRDFGINTTAYINYSDAPLDNDLRFQLYNYSVESAGNVVMTATY